MCIRDRFLTELKQKYLQFTIFDDEKEVNEDVYGIAKYLLLLFRANLTPLVDSTDHLDLKLEIRNETGEEIGKLFVKAGWI